MSAPIFIVDSSPAVRRMVEQISTPEGFEVLGFQDGPAALEAARRTNPAIIIADYHLDHMTFSGFCREIHKLEHLSETRLISLINSADHPDEGHLRSLGVTACLNKPVQADELLDAIRTTLERHHLAQNGASLRRRTWPPTAALTDSDQANDVVTPMLNVSSDRQGEHVVTQHEPSQPSISITPSPAGPQDAIKGFFDQILQSTVKEIESRFAEILPRMVEETLARRVQPMIEREVGTRLGEMLSADRMAPLIQPVISQGLPSLVGKEMAQSEPLIRQTASDTAGLLIKEKLDQWITDHAEAGLRKQTSDLLRARIEAMDQTIKDEVQSTVTQRVMSQVDHIVRSIAQEAVDRSVQHVVPELAEQHIKAELKRLTDPD
ncbi:MAG: response regulator [Nitrospira sp.]|nr:response regulator [Nitrospira sp.]